MRLAATIHSGEAVKNVCIRADRVEREDQGLLYAYDGDRLVGVFDVGSILVLYLSEERKE